MADIVTRVDDIDGETPDAERIEFAIRGVTFQIDLSEDHKKELFEAVRKFMVAARRVGTGQIPDDLRDALGDDIPHAIPASQPGATSSPKYTARTARRNSKEDLESVRAYAKTYGVVLAENSRVPNDVWEAWENNDVTRFRAGRLPK